MVSSDANRFSVCLSSDQQFWRQQMTDAINFGTAMRKDFSLQIASELARQRGNERGNAGRRVPTVPPDGVNDSAVPTPIRHCSPTTGTVGVSPSHFIYKRWPWRARYS
jgi:hypothetical protein